MISVFNLLIYSIIYPHHTFIKLLAKRENHHLLCRHGLSVLFSLFISTLFLIKV